MTTLVVRPIGVSRDRVLSTALDLFVFHGVTGTSLQMISETLGVTKSAVRHQFPTKGDLILALNEPVLEQMTRVAEVAESQRTRAGQREVALSGVVDVVVENRRLSAALTADATVNRLLREHPPMVAVNQRVYILLTGCEHDPDTAVAIAVIAGGLALACTDPILAELDDDTLRRHLLCSARRTLGLRAQARPRISAACKTLEVSSARA